MSNWLTSGLFERQQGIVYITRGSANFLGTGGRLFACQLYKSNLKSSKHVCLLLLLCCACKWM